MVTATDNVDATLVLIDEAGLMLGALAPVRSTAPWWNLVAPIVQAVQTRDGLAVTVLRLLSAERPAPPGGAVTYLAQVAAPVPAALLRPWPGALPDDPRRNAYARPGGPQADLAWARGALATHGLAPDGPAEQIRTWNLSSIWRLPLIGGASAWLKAVPPFFAHEGALLERLAGAPVPRLLGRDGGRTLLADIAGVDLHDAGLPQCHAMVDLLVALQARWLGRADELRALGLPDWRGPAITAALAALLARRRAELPADARVRLDAFIADLPARFDAVAACGLPVGLVHGDFHRGNLRGALESDSGLAAAGRAFHGNGESSDASGIDGATGLAPLTLLDWGDSGIGHPLLDQSAYLSRVPGPFVAPLRAHWARAWQRWRPDADVERAARLLAPVAAARMALIYQNFLDGIEAAEAPYHRADVVDWLLRTAGVLTGRESPAVGAG